MLHLIDITPHSTNIFNASYYIRVHCTFIVTAVINLKTEVIFRAYISPLHISIARTQAL